MDLDAISLFVKIVDAGSFTQAAARLGMPKATLSKRFAALERGLGVSLIQRTTRKLHVTEAGRRFYQHCVTALQELDQGAAELLASGVLPGGLLRITAPVDIGHALLPPIVKAYLDKWPDVRVEVRIENQVSDLIGEGIDLGIRAGHLRDSSLIGRRFFALTANLWASPDYLAAHGVPREPRELARHVFVSQGAAKSIELTNGRTVHKIVPATRVHSTDFGMLKALIALGCGIGWLPSFLVHRGVDDARLVPVLPRWEVRVSKPVYFVYPAQKYVSANVKAFIETALETIAGQTIAGQTIDEE